MTKHLTLRPGAVAAVLTGDIIGSTELEPKRLLAARQSVLQVTARFEQAHPGIVPGKPDFFRGDAWQLLLADPRLALRVALLIRATLRGELDLDTRIAIGIGTVDLVNPTRLSLSTGEAFTLSGHALDHMTGYFDLTAALPARAGALAQWVQVAIHLSSGLVRSWTQRQAEIFASALTLDTPTHERIAAALSPPVTKQTVTDSLKGANWRTLLEPIRAFESMDWQGIGGARADNETG